MLVDLYKEYCIVEVNGSVMDCLKSLCNEQNDPELATLVDKVCYRRLPQEAVCNVAKIYWAVYHKSDPRKVIEECL